MGGLSFLVFASQKRGLFLGGSSAISFFLRCFAGLTIIKRGLFLLCFAGYFWGFFYAFSVIDFLEVGFLFFFGSRLFHFLLSVFGLLRSGFGVFYSVCFACSIRLGFLAYGFTGLFFGTFLFTAKGGKRDFSLLLLYRALFYAFQRD